MAKMTTRDYISLILLLLSLGGIVFGFGRMASAIQSNTEAIQHNTQAIQKNAETIQGLEVNRAQNDRDHEYIIKMLDEVRVDQKEIINRLP